MFHRPRREARVAAGARATSSYPHLASWNLAGNSAASCSASSQSRPSAEQAAAGDCFEWVSTPLGSLTSSSTLSSGSVASSDEAKLRGKCLDFSTWWGREEHFRS